MSTGTLAPIVIAPAESAPVTGVRLVPATFCMYPSAIHPTDLMRVDFDQQAIGLAEILNDDGVEWRGCRRFLSVPQAGLQMDQSGEGDWVQVSAAWRLQTRVVGYVEEIYRPTLRAPLSQALTSC